MGLSRSLAIDKRKKTLLKEYEQSGKSSEFKDLRIGETDDTLQEYEKAVLRLQRERQLKLKRSSKYNLSDGEEEESGIHQTRSLSERDDFEEDVPLDDDEDQLEGKENGPNSSKYLSLHTAREPVESSLLDGEEKAHKTKKQVMSEVISKSKFYKSLKAKDKEEDDHLMEKLDQDFTSLAQTEALVSLTQPGKMNALKALLNRNSGKQSKEGLSGSADKESSKKEEPDAYDKLVKEMLLDMRAHPSDRTKTPEEIAQEERERLESLEEERRKRMLATGDSSDEDSSDGEHDHKSGSRKLKPVSGDDLGDSFSVDEVTENRKGWVDEIYNKEDEDNQDEDSTPSEGSESNEDDQETSDGEKDSDGNGTSGKEHGNMSFMKDWEQSDEDDDDLDTDEERGKDADEEIIKKSINEDDEDDDEEITNSQKTDNLGGIKTTSEIQAPLKQEELPYVIEAPNNLSELCSLLDGRSDTEVIEAINRIRASNSIRLAVENKRKMQIFYAVLLQYFAVSATPRPVNICILNSLVKPLIEMSVEIPFYAAICARMRLEHIRKQFCEIIKIPDKSSWPSLKTLLLLRLWTMIFPCSDFRHVVMTPAILLMCEYLIRCPIVSGRDIAVGSFLSSMVLSVAKQSHKFCPEAIIFLQTLLISSMKMEPKLQKNYQGYHLVELQTTKPWLRIRDQVSKVEPMNFLNVMGMEADSPFFASDNFKASILASVVKTIEGFVNVYKDLSSFPEIFLPVLSLLREVLHNAKLPSILRENIKGVVQLIGRTTEEHQMMRQPLQMRKEKPEPIKLLNPKFEESFVKGRDYDPDRERAERKKLKKLLKKEAKGAVRELRKDNHFIFGLKERDKQQEEEERAEKYGKARAFLQEQEHAFKSGQLGKGRKRRR